MKHLMATLSLLCVLSPLVAQGGNALPGLFDEVTAATPAGRSGEEQDILHFRRLLGGRKVLAAAELLERFNTSDRSRLARMHGWLGEAWIREGEAARGALCLRQALAQGEDLIPAALLKDWRLSLQVADIMSGAPRTTHGGWKTSTLHLSRDKVGLPRVEASLNGKAQECVWDTGANLSTVTETVALRLGLLPLPGSVEVNTPTGDLAKGRLALARHLELGSCSLDNVLFLVLPDKGLSFPQAGYSIECILGFPVIDSLGAIRVKADDSLVIGLPPRESDGSLLLEGLNPKLRVKIAGRNFAFLWDTGANLSMIQESSLSRLGKPVEILSGGKGHIAGAGGTSEGEAQVAKDLRLQFGSTVLRVPALRISKEPPGDAEPNEGVIGSDLMHAGGDYEFCLSTPYLVFLHPRNESD